MGRRLGLRPGVLGTLSFVVETLLSGAQLVEGIGLVTGLHLEQRPLGGVLLGGAGLEATHHVLVGRGDVGVDGEGHDLGPQGVDLGGGIGHRLFGPGRFGGARLDLALRVGQGGLLAPDVLVEGGQGGGDLLLVALEGVDLRGHLGLAGPHLLPLLTSALTGGPRRRTRCRRHQCKRDEAGGEGHREAASGTGA